MVSTHKDNEHRNALDLSALVEDEKTDRARQDRDLNTAAQSRNRKKILIFGSAIVAVVLVFGALIIYDPFTNSLRWGAGPKQTEVGATAPGGSGVQSTPEWWQEPSNKFPSPVQEWSKDAYNPKNQTDLEKQAYTSYFPTNIGMVGSGLPSESAGFTSNLSKAKLKNGAQNPDFSYWTDKVFTGEMGLMVERLINPVFGDWVDSEFLTNAPPTTLDDLFTDRAVQNMRNQRDRYPILIDTYNENLLDGGVRWVGSMKNFNVTLSYNAFTGQYGGTAKVDILYTAWTKDKKTVTKNATLTLNIVSNAGHAGNSSDNRILIDSASLAVHP